MLVPPFLCLRLSPHLASFQRDRSVHCVPPVSSLPHPQSPQPFPCRDDYNELFLLALGFLHPSWGPSLPLLALLSAPAPNSPGRYGLPGPKYSSNRSRGTHSSRPPLQALTLAYWTQRRVNKCRQGSPQSETMANQWLPDPKLPRECLKT